MCSSFPRSIETAKNVLLNKCASSVRRRGYVLHNRPSAPTPPRHQASAWRPSSQAATQPVAISSSSSSTGKAREGVVLLRRSSARSSAGDRSKQGSNAPTSHERKSKGGKNVASTSSTASPSGKQCQKVASSSGGSSGSGNWKGRRSGWEARFLFKDPEVAGDTETPEPESAEKDTRTTVMIRNIPNKYRYHRYFIPHCCNNASIFHGRRILRVLPLLMLEAFWSQPETAAQHAGQPLHPVQRADRGEWRGPDILVL
jgi:hypothetical protein